jgi:hypothetical protein
MSGELARQTLWGFCRWRVGPVLVERVLRTRVEKVDGLDGAITMGRTGIERRLVDKPVAKVAVTASDLVAGREPAQLTRRFVMLPRTGLIMMCRS